MYMGAQEYLKGMSQGLNGISVLHWPWSPWLFVGSLEEYQSKAILKELRNLQDAKAKTETKWFFILSNSANQ